LPGLLGSILFGVGLLSPIDHLGGNLTGTLAQPVR